MKRTHITTSTIHDGDMRDSKKGGNLEKFLESYGVTKKNLITMHQIHSEIVKPVSGKNKGERIEKCDGIVTNEKDAVLGVYTADCLPIVLSDEKNDVLALVHAGYRGIIKNIVQKALSEMISLGASVDSISVHIGPGIEDCCYDIDDKRIKIFGEIFPLNGEVSNGRGKKYLSLKKIVKNDLIRKGITEKKIHVSPVCTKCSERHFSFRRNNSITGLNITLARMTS